MDTQKHLNDYLTCALWSTFDENIESSDAEFLDDKYSISDLSDEALEQAQRDVAAFMEDATPHLHNDDKHQIPGHDFWLTRNGHGAGFWDGDYVNGNKLTRLSLEYGEIDFYAGDDGKLYFG